MGFTLVELLVVISIIGTLASTVFASVNSARTKADNTARKSTVEQYRNAFELAYNTDGDYPDSAGETCPGVYGPICLGKYPTGTCVYSTLTFCEKSDVSSAIDRYLKSRPPLKQVVHNDGSVADGPLYSCKNSVQNLPNPPICLESYIEWFMQGINQECGFGITTIPTTVGYTLPNLSGTTLCGLRIK